MHAQVQRLVSILKMTMVLEESTIEEQPSVLLSFVGKGLIAKDIHK
jgi:hypothetical protein